ncbi:MAG TPA: hypothetical protein VKT19_03155 [Steroidobacteraceae bacterium]|nr:hypothetical protein [Steroidobacteraceae bacterium]
MIWSILGCLLLVAALVVIARMPGVSLGPYSTRLLGIGVVCAGYYGTLHWLRFGFATSHMLRWYAMRYIVPAVAGAAALYCLLRVVQDWRSEVHGLARTLLILVLLLVLGALAWLALRR